MRYLPKSPADRAAMLQEIGVTSIDDLFSTVPAEYRLTRDMNVPRQHSEHEVVEAFKLFASQNATGYSSFLGAGAYRHYRPVLIDTLSPARRVPDQLYALPAGDRTGHAAGAV